MKPWQDRRVSTGESDASGPKSRELAHAAEAATTMLASAAPATRKRIAVSSSDGKIM